MVAKPAASRNREKWGRKTAPYAVSVSYNFGGLGCVVVSVVLVVRIGGVYGVTIRYTV